MKRYITGIIFGVMLLFAKTTFAKEIETAGQVFDAYKQNKLTVLKDTAVIEERLAQLLNKLKSEDLEQVDPERDFREELILLASIRAYPSKTHLEHLTALWNYHAPHTYKARHGELWKYVKGIDYAQRFCDEIADIYSKCGGVVNDLTAPLLREQSDLVVQGMVSEIREVRKESKNSESEPLNPVKVEDYEAKLSVTSFEKRAKKAKDYSRNVVVLHFRVATDKRFKGKSIPMLKNGSVYVVYGRAITIEKDGMATIELNSSYEIFEVQADGSDPKGSKK